MFLKLAKDTVNIMRAPLPISRRLRLLSGLLHAAAGSTHLLDWEITNLGRLNLILLYSEIFARQTYYFASGRPDPVILDCGANIGLATFYFKWLYPQAHITAFEPDPSTFQVLKTNLEQNRIPGVAVHNVALGASDAEIDFHVSEPGSLTMSALASRATGRTIKVPSTRLSSFITGPVDLLKMDVEGLEGPVLQELDRSGKLLLVREAIVEIHHNLADAPLTLADVLQLLESSGFAYHVTQAYAPSPDCSTFQDIVVHAVRR